MVNNTFSNVVKMITAIIATVSGFILGLSFIIMTIFNTGLKLMAYLIIGVLVFILGPVIGFKIIRTVGEK